MREPPLAVLVVLGAAGLAALVFFAGFVGRPPVADGPTEFRIVREDPEGPASRGTTVTPLDADRCRAEAPALAALFEQAARDGSVHLTDPADYEPRLRELERLAPGRSTSGYYSYAGAVFSVGLTMR